jgi:hypothetical protein
MSCIPKCGRRGFASLSPLLVLCRAKVDTTQIVEVINVLDHELEDLRVVAGVFIVTVVLFGFQFENTAFSLLLLVSTDFRKLLGL